MTKYHLKFIKYILPSSKDWTRVGLLSYRDVHLHSSSISRENIDILSIDLALNHGQTTTTKTYCKRATSDENILGIRKETRARLLNLLIVGDNREHICISNSQRNFVLLSYIPRWLSP
jgi:hypothetical protein